MNQRKITQSTVGCQKSLSILLKTASQLDCDDSYLESIPNQEMLTVQDLDTHTNLKLTSAMFKRMSTLKPGLKVQDQIFDKYMMDLKHALKQLFELAHEGDTNKICELIRKYPLSLNVTSPDSTENTLLHIAAKYGHSSLMDYLLSQNKQLLNIVNKYDRTPIIFLMVWHPSLLRHILVQFDGDIEWKWEDNNGNGYLHYAYFYGIDSEIIQIFAARCDPEKENIFKLTPKLVSQDRQIFSSRRRAYNIETLAAGRQPGFGSSLKVETTQPLLKLRKGRSERVARNQHEQSLLFKSKIPAEFVDSSETKLEDFQLVKLLGRGAFADVYEVIHKRTNKIYALKSIYKFKMDHTSMRYAYNQKDLLANFNHPAVVKFFCSFQNRDYLFLLLELCQNHTLRELIRRPILLSQDYVKLLAAELVQVIGYLHENCVLYRDLKPENIGIDSKGHIKLLDFGFAKETGRSDSICGNLHYSAPQIISKTSHSFDLDWYMLGIIIFELMQKKVPFIADTVEELQNKIITEQIQTLNYVSPELQDLLKKLIEKDPNNRIGHQADSDEIKKHSWFRSINWDRIKKRQYNMSTDYFYIDTIQSSIELLNMPEVKLQRPDGRYRQFEYMESWELTCLPFV